jgi:hypothetical protein
MSLVKNVCEVKSAQGGRSNGCSRSLHIWLPVRPQHHKTGMPSATPSHLGKRERLTEQRTHPSQRFGYHPHLCYSIWLTPFRLCCGPDSTCPIHNMTAMTGNPNLMTSCSQQATATTRKHRNLCASLQRTISMNTSG